MPAYLHANTECLNSMCRIFSTVLQFS